MIMETLKSILIDLGIDEASLNDSAHLRKDLELDSTETVEIALEVKRRLGAEIKLESRKDPTLTEVCEQINQAQISKVS